MRKAELIDRLCEAAESAGGAKVPAENNENRENTAAPMQAAAQKEKAPAAGNVSGSAALEPLDLKLFSDRITAFQRYRRTFSKLPGNKEASIVSNTFLPGCSDLFLIPNEMIKPE